ncbi:MAG: CoA activase, partial [Acidobacteria bacterium]|nr:CoA activase [Acidobacteriota bacterium]
MRMLALDPDDALYLEALGSAVIAAENPGTVPPPESILAAPAPVVLERLPPLHQFSGLVTRMKPAPEAAAGPGPLELVLGFDIGSTGSKAAAWDAGSRKVCWEGYRRTAGDPVGAAQGLARQFLEERGCRDRVLAVGVTGSGREIVGSLMATCFGTDSVFVLNEIAAHAAGALHFDLCVDTIFEIGGQDAKYIRLSDGRVVDCAMNEACSAGTGSFIEEQGSRFPQFTDVPGLGHAAMAAPGGVSLGQHCSVFMAEVIEEAFGAGIRRDVIVAGLYDSIIQNYLNRVKGNRSVGRVIFCQGMPFQADALAAAVARQTGSRVVVPPNPGTIGALGIALLAEQALPLPELPALDLPRFLAARIEKRDTFICKSTTGCGGSGNRCRIDFIHTLVERERKRFNWGGGCSLYDRGASRKKLPDLAPDPMREREILVHELVEPRTRSRGKPVVALADEFMLKGLFPFFAAYLVELGLDLLVVGGADQDTLRRGIQEANVPFCAPMQLFQGLASKMADTDADFLFLPMIRSSPRNSG